VSGDVIVYESRAVGTKLVGLVEVANWGRLAAAVLLGPWASTTGPGRPAGVNPPERGGLYGQHALARERTEENSHPSRR
jgi:hypothetical protein